MDASHDVAGTAEGAVDASMNSSAPNANPMFSWRPIAFLVFLLGLTAAFAVPLVRLFIAAYNDEMNSYIVLIPLVVLYLLYLTRSRLPRVYQSTVRWALPPLLISSAILIGLATGLIPSGGPSNNDHFTLIALSYACLVWSGGFLLLGKQWMTAAAFPMFFLIFLAPLPDRLVDWMETALRLASAEAANFLFAVTGTAAARTGTIFELPGMTIQVAQECSGIHSTWVLFITSIVAAHLFLSKTWSRLTLIGTVLPLAIARNGFRIMVIGLLCVYVDPDLIHSYIHHHGGPIFFALSLIPFFGVLWFLRRLEASKRSPAMTKVTDRVPA